MWLFTPPCHYLIQCTWVLYVPGIFSWEKTDTHHTVDHLINNQASQGQCQFSVGGRHWWVSGHKIPFKVWLSVNEI